MGHLLIVLCETPFHSDKTEKAFKIAEATLNQGHELSIFLFMDGVYNMIKTQNGEPFKVTPSSKRLKVLMEKGAKIYSCKLCKMLRGIEDYWMQEGIEASGIAELNDLMGVSDAVISFTG